MGWLAEAGVVAGAIAAFFVAAGVIAKSPIGKLLAFVFRRLFGEPISDYFRKFIAEEVTPQIGMVRAEIAALDFKNDQQHAENSRSITHLRESIVEHRVEINDHLFEIRKAVADHLVESADGFRRIDALEGLAKVRIELERAEPVTGETPTAAPSEEER